MPRVTRCAVCHAKDAHYLLTERQTRLQVNFCAGCLRNAVRFLSHPQDLARCLRASRGVFLDSSLAGARQSR